MGTQMSRRAFVAGTLGAVAMGLGACRQDDEATEAHDNSQSLVAVVEKEQEPEEEQPAAQAEEEPMASDDADRSIRFFDLHADTVDTLCMSEYEPYASVDSSEVHEGTLASTDACVSANRMGEVQWAQCYAIWTPDECPSVSHLEFYRHGAKFFHEQMDECKDVVMQVRKGSEIMEALDAGKVAALLTVENSVAIDQDNMLDVVDEFDRDGVLMCGLTWNGANALAGGASTDLGLTDLGREYIRELEARHKVVDVSHLCDKSLQDVLDVAARPVVASHSNSRAICGVPRNLTDDQFKAMAERGGLVGLNLCTWFVHSGEGDYDVDQLCTHVEHWLDLGGEDVVAFGSDRDGSGIPAWIADCSHQGELYGKMAKKFGGEVTRKLFFENALAFFQANAK